MYPPNSDEPLSPDTSASQPVMRPVPLPLAPVWVTYVLLAIITLVFATQMGVWALMRRDWVLIWAAKVNELIAVGQWWRLVTPIFVHVDLMHFVVNAYSLYNIGQSLEQFYGAVRYSLVFLLTGIAGVVASMLFSPNASAGASGALFGLIGAEVTVLYFNRALLGPAATRALQNLAVIIVINLAIGTQGNIDNWGHLGGLVGGLALGALISPLWAVQTTLSWEAPRIADTRPLAGPQWLAVLGFSAGLLGLTAFAIYQLR